MDKKKPQIEQQLNSWLFNAKLWNLHYLDILNFLIQLIFNH